MMISILELVKNNDSISIQIQLCKQSINEVSIGINLSSNLLSFPSISNSMLNQISNEKL
jgi:hypothetical protein